MINVIVQFLQSGHIVQILIIKYVSVCSKIHSQNIDVKSWNIIVIMNIDKSIYWCI